MKRLMDVSEAREIRKHRTMWKSIVSAYTSGKQVIDDTPAHESQPPAPPPSTGRCLKKKYIKRPTSGCAETRTAYIYLRKWSTQLHFLGATAVHS
ncbi:hypothetical protein EVAR_86016_1 [Eumeta japonica]|uniref:Uncharacterized protein n=1 Tax=Eumeta variegata TaxID=151549 RepID=A0A4C1UKV4_EUMVA|nr:hypothetical protein EVAR_86016_1 [Eumeta japonica]